MNSPEYEVYDIEHENGCKSLNLIGETYQDQMLVAILAKDIKQAETLHDVMNQLNKTCAFSIPANFSAILNLKKHI